MERVSVVIPVYNEEENVSSLIDEIMAVEKKFLLHEIIYVDDGSTDNTLKVLKELKQQNLRLRVLHHQDKCGQSAGLRTGILNATGDLIATLDGDGQNDPADIPKLIDALRQNQSKNKNTMVLGARLKRQDSFIRKVSSKVANTVRSAILRDGVKDSGSGLKVFPRSLYLRLPYFNHMHRFFPSLVKREGGDIITTPVNHRPRTKGKSKYGTIDRLLVGIVDLFGVAWLHRRGFKQTEITEE